MQKVLLLDDNPLVRRVWSVQLQSDGYQVLAVDEATEALDVVQREHPQVVLVDSELPDVDGVALCQRLVRARDASGLPHVILLTNDNNPRLRARVDAGAAHDLWLKYELEPRDLSLRIHHLLGDGDAPSHLCPRMTLGEALVAAGYFSTEALADAEILRCQEKLDLDEALSRRQLLAPGDIRYLRELLYRADYVDLAHYHAQDEALALVAQEVAVRRQVLPLRLVDGELEVVMADPRDVETRDFLARATGRCLRVLYAPLAELQKAQLMYYGGAELLHRGAAGAGAERSLEPTLMDDRTVGEILDERPVVELVDMLLMRARQSRASDIHVEPGDGYLRVRMRVDGMLHEVYRLDAEHARSLVTRIKVISGLNLVETRLPQDGRFRMTFADGYTDYRVSTLPVADGEKVVVRVLDSSAAQTRLEDLGLDGEPLEKYLAMARRPHGMVVITGPTGSGKTTTLFATLKLLLRPEINMVSIEDPVEIRLDGVNQVQVNPKVGLTFANVLRTVLRQDPNVILVGEIRDEETAELAVQAALTGHLVLCTLHTNDAPQGLIRLIDMGVPPYMVCATVNGLVAQRLMRRVCAECREPLNQSRRADDPVPVGVPGGREGNPPELPAGPEPGPRAVPPELAGVTLYRGRGCKSCHRTGYRGRVAIYEVLPVSRELRDIVMDSRDPERLEEQARAEGMRTLRQSALRKVQDGISTLDEVWRVTLDE